MDGVVSGARVAVRRVDVRGLRGARAEEAPTRPRGAGASRAARAATRVRRARGRVRRDAHRELRRRARQVSEDDSQDCDKKKNARLESRFMRVRFCRRHRRLHRRHFGRAAPVAERSAARFAAAAPNAPRTPLVTAEIAAAYDQGLVRTVEEARAFLAKNARDLGRRGRDPEFGAGLLQLSACR